MAIRRPFRINGTNGLQEMSNIEMQWMRWLIAQAFVDDEDTGSVRINSAPGGWNNIGAVTDQSRSQGRRTTNIGNVWGVGPSNANVNAPGSLGNVTYTFYQNRNNLTQTPSNAVQNAGPLVANNGDYSDLIPMSYSATQDIYDTIIDEVYTDIRNQNVNGLYQIATSAPANFTTTGYSLTDRRVTPGNTGGPTSTTWTLYQRRNVTAPTIIRPVRFDTSGGVVEMTNAEIEAFFMPYFRNRHTEGGRGQYTFDTTSGNNLGTFTQRNYTGTTNASLGQRISGHTYYRDVTSLSSTTFYFRRNW